MKLYYWCAVKYLADYGDGQCFALANSLDEAIEVICETVNNPLGLMEELLNTEPIIVDSPQGFTIIGSA